MPRFSANVGFLFPELPLPDRFAAAAKAGFRAVECHFPYDYPKDLLRERLLEYRLELVGLNTWPGDAAAGEFGLAALPGRDSDFDRVFTQALDYAQALEASAIHVMAGRAAGGERERAEEVLKRNLERAAKQAEGTGVLLLIEPINERDAPGYVLSRSDQAARIIAEVGTPNLRMMFDFYHVQIMEGDLIMRLRRHFPLIGHIQIAAVPSRAEPDEGEVNYPAILAEIDRLGYTGHVGCEYKPRGRTEDGLHWLRNWSLELR